ncbi:MAG: aliphatic sulfonate ABC transporter substrate-binding protein [Armatimonadetes bacterium]|nr:aliphatic sulfonate ABC transporter substrate-binding protein [Armatimonadota bacterium]
MNFGSQLGLPALTLFAVSAGLIFLGPKDAPAASRGKSGAIRVAYFPNITHAPGLIGIGKGIWQRDLAGYRVEPMVVNAGPEAIEALLAKEIDFSFVGPSPAVNAYLKSNGKALRIISGACLGGASLIRRADVQISGVRDLDGKRVAVPQLGGTQDVSCRYFLSQNGLRAKERGGTVEIAPIKNPDILALFLQKQVDAAWVPEPWAARIKKEAGAKTVVDERDLWPEGKFSTTVLVVRAEFADAHPDVVTNVLRAHLDTLEWIRQHDAEAKVAVNSELKRLTGKALEGDVLNEAWSHVLFSEDPNEESIDSFAKAATVAGYQKPSEVSLSGLIDTQALTRARKDRQR